MCWCKRGQAGVQGFVYLCRASLLQRKILLKTGSCSQWKMCCRSQLRWHGMIRCNAKLAVRVEFRLSWKRVDRLHCVVIALSRLLLTNETYNTCHFRPKKAVLNITVSFALRNIAWRQILYIIKSSSALVSWHQALTLTACASSGTATLTYDGTTLGYSGNKCVKPQGGGSTPADDEELVIQTGCSGAASTFHFAGRFW